MLLHYLEKLETRKLHLFTQMLDTFLPKTRETHFKISPDYS